MGPSHDIELSQDATLVAALAGTAMSFSHSADDQAERWLRALRLHGEVGCALQALGVGEAPLTDASYSNPVGAPPLGSEAMDRVIRRACEHARARHASLVCTPDLLFALLEVYDGLIDRSLEVRGASREELAQRLASGGSRCEA